MSSTDIGEETTCNLLIGKDMSLSQKIYTMNAKKSMTVIRNENYSIRY